MLIATNQVVVTIYDHEYQYEKLIEWWKLQHAEIFNVPNGVKVITSAKEFNEFTSEFDIVDLKDEPMKLSAEQ